MATEVLVGPNAPQLANQFLSAQATFSEAANRVLSVGTQLTQPAEWQGASEKQFATDLQAYKAAVTRMEESLQRMGKAAQTVTSRIESDDASGASTFGTFSG